MYGSSGALPKKVKLNTPPATHGRVERQQSSKASGSKVGLLKKEWSGVGGTRMRAQRGRTQVHVQH